MLAEVIGWGGSGVVYAARHADLDKRVALKTLVGGVASEADRARFLREGRAACRITHPCCVDVIDVGVDQGMPFLVMELLQGEDLRSRLRREGSVPLEALVDAFLGVIGALASAHRAGVVHRDLKPANLFLVRDLAVGEQMKVLDFGISKVVHSDTHDSHSESGAAFVGTPYYVAPEQARRARDADEKSDQYALGVILYEGLTGQRPFVGESLFATLELIREGELRRPRDVVADIPEALEDVVLRAMHRDPARRFPSVRELGVALAPFASDAARERWLSPLSATMQHSTTDGFDELARTLTASGDRGRARLAIPIVLVAAALVTAAVVWSLKTAPVSHADEDRATSAVLEADLASETDLEPTPPTAPMPVTKQQEVVEQPESTVPRPRSARVRSIPPAADTPPADTPRAGPLTVDEF